MGHENASVELLVSTTPDTPAMERAINGEVPAIYLSPGDSPEGDFDTRLLNLLRAHEIELICLAGFMRKIGPRVVRAYPHRIINVHPSLVPAFGGPGMYGSHVHEAVLAYGAKVSGCTVQFINEEYDAGPIILQRPVPVLEEDSLETLAARVLVEEHTAYVEAIKLFAEGRLKVEGRRVRVAPQPVSRSV